MALTFAVALCWYQVSTRLYSKFVLGLAVSAGAYGAFLLFSGGRVVRHPSVARIDDEPITPLAADELARQIAENPLPYGLCTRCRVIDRPPAFHGRCPRCDASAGYLVVEDDAERSLASSAAGS